MDKEQIVQKHLAKALEETRYSREDELRAIYAAIEEYSQSLQSENERLRGLLKEKYLAFKNEERTHYCWVLTSEESEQLWQQFKKDNKI